MLLKAFLFSLITLGICMAVSLVVAAIIKAIGAAVQKREDKAAENKAD
jgi:Na+-transporting methylmalonyl-CoA/oxaloacetate decarboxylase gamma subunit